MSTPTAVSTRGLGHRSSKYVGIVATAAVMVVGGILLGGGSAKASTSIMQDVGNQMLTAPVVGIAPAVTGGGYFEVASNGGIFSGGRAVFQGSAGGETLAKPVVGMAIDQRGGGYWEVASDGGIFTFGNARFYGSMGGYPLAAPVVGIAAV